MNRAAIQEHLALAEIHITRGEQIVARQRRLLDELARDGQDSRLAAELLRAFEATQVTCLAHRDRLRDELSEAGAAA